MPGCSRTVGGWLVLVVAVAGLGACREGKVDYPARPVPAGVMEDPAAIARGAALFASRCASCHGHPGEGRSERANFFQPPAPDFYQPRYATIDPAYVYWRIAEGKNVEPFAGQGSVMPAWGSYFDEQTIWALVAYLRHRVDSR